MPRVRRPAPRRLPAARARADRRRRRGRVELRGRLARRPAGRQPDLRRARGPGRLSELGSAPLPPVGPADHVRGPEAARLVVVYADFECPFCAALELRLRELPLRVALPPLPRPLQPPARLARRPRRRGGRPAGPLLGDARQPVRRPGAARGPAPVGARRAARARRRALRRRPPLRAGRGAHQRPISAPACAPGWPPRRRCSPTASGTPGARIRRSSKRSRTRSSVTAYI